QEHQPTTTSDRTLWQPLQAQTIIGGVVYHGPIPSLQGKYIYGDYWTNHTYVADFDRNTDPATFNGANLTNLQEVNSTWESLIEGHPSGRNLELPVSYTEDSHGNLYIVSFANSPTDSLTGGSARNSAGLNLGEIYELVALPEGDYNHNGVVDTADY